MAEKTNCICDLKKIQKYGQKYKLPSVDFIKTKFNSPFKILVSALLSARTKDATTEKVCLNLFKKVKKPKDFQRYSLKQIEQFIYPVGFYKTKARHLKKLARVLEKDFHGKIPRTLEGLLKLPGVGRKTANLTLAVGFNQPAVCVDTHVHRISNRLGWVKTRTPQETEKALQKIFPKKYWPQINKTLVVFGQNLCFPVKPACLKCPIKRCPSRT